MNTKLSFICILLASAINISAQRLDIDGQWKVIVPGFTAKTITMPTTLDMAGIGQPTALTPELRKPDGTINADVLRHLTRKVSYVGPADYEREITIDRAMVNKPLRVVFERVMWKSVLLIDGKESGGSCESLSTPHVFLLKKGLEEGRHTIRLHIDNTKQYDLSYDDMAHAYTDHTQTKWNGVLGKMYIEVEPTIKDIQVYPIAEEGKVKVVLSHDRKLKSPQFVINDTKRNYKQQDDSTYVIDIPDAREWSEFNPYLYNMVVTSGEEYHTRTFGMRSLTSEHGQLMMNGKPFFLRSTLECCIFPLIGCPPTNEEGWRSVFSKAKQWGLNSLRFHSYCPPEAAFAVADKMGFYLQVELPNWTLNIGSNPDAEAFFYREFDRIVKAYGNHPSFCLMTPGNELQKDFDYLNKLCRYMKEKDPRHLYATTTFTFENGHGGKPEPEDQFFVTQWTSNGWVRGQGVFDEKTPDFTSNYASSMKDIDVPLISHEIGQYSVYPNMREIEKYSGTLLPLNLEAIRNDLRNRGLLDKADCYTQASGRLALLLYKEEIERALKTPGFSGYQLLGLQDFSGQSTALVGLVDAFWDNKGICSEDYFRQFCAPVVPLSYHAKAVWTTDEAFTSHIEVANYSVEEINGKRIVLTLSDSRDNTLYSNAFVVNIPYGKNTFIADMNCNLKDLGIADAEQLTLSAKIDGTPYRNSWKLWVYNNDACSMDAENVFATTSVDDAIKMANNGKSVLLYPADKETVNGLEGKFLPVFWSPVHFPKQAGTMGLLLNPQHPAFSHFPTDIHSDWQWWNVVKSSRVMQIDSIPEAEPIIESIDNFANNRRLCQLFEARLGKGRIIVSSIELGRQLPEIQHLLYSVKQYMTSELFAPRHVISGEQLRSLFVTDKKQKGTDAMSIYE